MRSFWITHRSPRAALWFGATILVIQNGSLLAQQPIELDCKELTESSGVAACLQDKQLVWTHNDSGGRPRLYLFSAKNGKLRGVYEIKDAPNYDWEDICSFKLAGKNYLAIGDIGDNPRRRDHIEIIIVEEPTTALDPSTENPARGSSKISEKRLSDLSTQENSGSSVLEDPIQLTTAAILSIRYPDGAYDCESLAFDPGRSRLILITKDFIAARIFGVPLKSDWLSKAGAKESVAAEHIQTIAMTLATGADICAENRQLVICNYATAYAMDLLSEDNSKWDAKNMKRVDAPKRLQGEAIAYLDANTLAFTSEGSPAPLWKMELKFVK